MGTLSGLLIAILAVSAVVVVLAVSTVGVRAARNRRLQRQVALAVPLRPLVLAVATEDPPPAEALDALSRLGRREWEAVEPGLVELLAKVRGSGRSALATVLDRRGVGRDAQRACRSSRALRRAQGAHRLGLIHAAAGSGAGESLAAVTPLLADRHPEVRRVAARAVGRIGSPGSVAALLDTLVDPRPVPPRVVAQALLDTGAAAGPDLVDAVGDPRPEVAATAVEVLGHLRHIPAGAVLVDALHGGDDEVRVRAARALGRIGTPASIGPLLDAAQPGRPLALRVVALGSLRRLGDPAVAARLAELLADADPRVAAAAGRTLAELGPPGVRTLASVAARPGDAGRQALAALASAEMAGARAVGPSGKDRAAAGGGSG